MVSFDIFTGTIKEIVKFISYLITAERWDDEYNISEHT